jgi:hypothetical protein
MRWFVQDDQIMIFPRQGDAISIATIKTGMKNTAIALCRRANMADNVEDLVDKVIFEEMGRNQAPREKSYGK